jgi:hypothetical protein
VAAPDQLQLDQSGHEIRRDVISRKADQPSA